MRDIAHKLEIKRNSITRLKRELSSLYKKPHITWNQKKLDYEIETMQKMAQQRSSGCTWNQKKLDYEIETLFSGV